MSATRAYHPRMTPVAALFFALLPIAAARQQTAGTTVTIVGEVTVASGAFASSSNDQGFALHDQTGGIWVSTAKNPQLRRGQRVRVTGAVGTNAGKRQIVAAEITPLAAGALLVATGQVGAATAGDIITIEGTIAQAAADDLPYGYKLAVDDGSGAVQVYINKSAAIDPRASFLSKGRRVRVAGFCSQYNSTYEIDPRDRSDIVALPQAASARAAVEKFCTVYLRQHEYGLLEGRDRAAIAPLLTARLLRQLDDARACQKDWFRQQPKETTDKPPFVDCCLFSSVPDGMPASFTLGPSEAERDGRVKVVINFARESIVWHDAAIVKKENGRWAIDDFVYDLDREKALLSKSFSDCRGGRWVGSP